MIFKYIIINALQGRDQASFRMTPLHVCVSILSGVIGLAIDDTAMQITNWEIEN